MAELAPKADVPPTIRKLPSSPSARPLELRPDGVEPPTPTEPAPRPPAVTPRPASPPLSPSPKPLSPERFKVTFTADRELRDKLERLQALMQEDLLSVIEAAVTEKLERLEARRYGETKSPRKKLEDTDTWSKSRYLPAALRRAVRKRDGDQCRFLGKNGRRSTERQGLQFHHHDPFGRGGDHDPANVSLMCPQHNAYLAELEYGKEKTERYRASAGRAREPGPIYVVGNPPSSVLSSPWNESPLWEAALGATAEGNVTGISPPH